MSISIQSSVTPPPQDLAPRSTARPADTATTPLATARQDKETPKEQTLKSAISKIEEFVGPLSAELKFSIDDDSGLRIVKVIDKSNNEVIRQIPSEEIVEMAKALERLQGLLLRQSA